MWMRCSILLNKPDFIELYSYIYVPCIFKVYEGGLNLNITLANYLNLSLNKYGTYLLV